ncbi:DUF4040 domain-containing protein [Mobilitalea sibirica]|uniref:DUF4040 domain-containing protein n=1 Tax=Mobilitalea sibirica TaxID=1462919 RepID=A0A8J7H4E1_9FIRM|nr:DUF4040 domain-containing protein [Mobilitalea sibirica]MBH1939346.1 DUF4040 domain-containing protein [Mobilitalea sibirica]
MLEKVCLIMMVILAIASINTVKLRVAVVYLAIFSLVSSYVYLLYSAPDVAIAEAIMAAGLTTVIFLVAINKHKAIKIFYINDNTEKNDKKNKKRDKGNYPLILKDIERFLKQKELEPNIITTYGDPNVIIERENFDYLLQKTENKVLIFGREKDHHFKEMEEFFRYRKYKGIDVSIIHCEERIDNNA